MDSKKLALLCRDLADHKKADDIVVLDMRQVSSIADYFVIATGTSEPHLRAIREEITTKLKDDYSLRPRSMEGSLHAAWIVVDYFDVIVHLMSPDLRHHYNLESLWGDAPRLRSRRKTKPVRA